MSRKIVSLTLFSVFLVSAIAVVSVVAQPRIVGVDVGDWFKYGEISVEWSSTDPNATVPSYLVELNDTEYAIISILGVSGTNVTCEMTMHFINGTEEITGGYVDIDTGDGENVTSIVISADLGENDAIYTSGMYSTWKINETITRTYPDMTRDTNHLNITGEYNRTGVYQYMSMNYYWDRSTGMLVEMSQESITQQDGVNTTMSMLIRITESNVWVVPEFPIWESILLTFSTLTAVTVLLRRRILKTLIN